MKKLSLLIVILFAAFFIFFQPPDAANLDYQDLTALPEANCRVYNRVRVAGRRYQCINGIWKQND